MGGGEEERLTATSQRQIATETGRDRDRRRTETGRALEGQRRRDRLLRDMKRGVEETWIS